MWTCFDFHIAESGCFFNDSSAHFFLIVSIIGLLLRVVFTVLGTTFAERNLSIVKDFLSIETMKLGKEVVASSMLLSLSTSVSMSGWHLLDNLNEVHWVLCCLNKLFLSFLLVLCSTNYYKVQLMLRIYHGGTHSP